MEEVWTIDDHFAGTSDAVVELVPAVSLTGSPNAPATLPGANDPGLSDAGERATSPMKKHWVWIVLVILAVLLGLWYWNSSSSEAAA